jgi:hypothetical protein
LNVSNHIIERYIQLQLAEYRRIFRSTDEVSHDTLSNVKSRHLPIQAGQLDNVPRRYAWFRRVLKSHDEEDSSLFPSSWQVTKLLISSFSEYTRTDLGNVLGKAVPTVTTLLEALQGTLDFEGAMSKRLEIPFEDIVETSLPGQAVKGRWKISSVFDQHFSIYVDAQDR